MGGFVKAFGIFFAEFSEKFESSASATSLIACVRATMFTFVAPLASLLCDRYSERSVLMLSATLSVSGCFLAAFAQNMATVIVGVGVLMGAGMSCFFAPVQMAIGKYFVRLKSVAISVVFGGMCLSQIVMAPIIVIVLREFALQGTLILYSGLLLHLAVAAALVFPRDLEDANDQVPAGSDKATEMTDLKLSSQCEAQHIETNPADLNMQPPVQSLLSVSESTYMVGKSNDSQQNPQVRFVQNPTTNVILASNRRLSASFRGKLQRCPKWTKSLVRALDLSLIKNSRFTLYALAQCSAQIAFMNIPVYLFPRAEDYRVSKEDGALLLTIMGCTDLFARAVFGILGDVQKIGPKFIFTWGAVLYGMSAAALPFTTGFAGMSVVCGFLGLFASTTIALNMPILVDMVGVRKLAKAIALTSFISGITTAVAPPLLGHIRDVTNSYNIVFFICAGTLFLSAGFMFTDPILQWWRRRKGRQTRESNDHGQMTEMKP
ncbi:monocarboxylate transporter 7-like [Liolophura sinensis]|uniref:monocarboxylate transporter 7-like n=1 Tax=Liolophura sinensis TaxID=3198878 RepID=UPI003158C8C3